MRGYLRGSFPQFEIKMFLFYHFLWKYVHWLAQVDNISHVVILITDK